MCTIGGLGRHIDRYIGRLSVDHRSAIDRLSVDSRSTVDRQSTYSYSQPIVDRYIDRQSTDISTDSRPVHHPICTHLSVNSRPIVDRYIGRLSADASADMCTFISRLSADISVYCRPIYRSTVDRQSVYSRPIVGPQSTDISADMSTEATYSTHDPGWALVASGDPLDPCFCSWATRRFFFSLEEYAGHPGFHNFRALGSLQFF